MHKKVNEPVSVNLAFNHKKRTSSPTLIIWNNKQYKITKKGLHHTYKKGDTTFHVFSVATETINFRLVLDGTSLNWVLEEIYDPNLS